MSVGRWLLLVAVVALVCCSVNGFTVVGGCSSHYEIATLRMAAANENDTHDNSSNRAPFQNLRQLVLTKWIVPVTLGGVLSVGSPFYFRPKAAFASAPVMVPVRQEMADPETEAMFDNNKRLEKKNAEEMQEFQQKAREIAAQKGQGARRAYENEWEAARQARAQVKAAGLEALKRELLDQGLDPFTDPEANRQIIKYEKGIDLGEVPGTKYYMEQDFQKNQPKRSMLYQKAPNRYIIKCMVQDMKRKGKDPLEYFQQNQDKTADLLNMNYKKATLLAEQYKEKMDKWGQLTEPKEGERVVDVGKEEALKVKEKAETKAAEVKAAAKEAKQRAKEEARQLKAQEKQKQAELKAEAKKQKDEAKMAAAAAAAVAAAAAADAAAAAAAAAADAVATGVGGLTAETKEATTVMAEIVERKEEAADVADTSVKTQTDKKIVPFVPAAVVVAVGGGGFAFKVLQEKAERDEEARQRQYKLIMGLSDKDDNKHEKVDVDDLPTPTMEKEDVDLDDNDFIEPAAPAKQRRGFKTMFGKRNASDRETDLNVLVSEGAAAQEFALLLSKLLTFGAPGRFPRVVTLPGKMPMAEFDLDAAKKMLEEVAGDISNEEAAEIFANVVNCMLIDIVDLASSTLKEDDKVTVDAINVVVDFMNHAASLYDSVAEGVVITPVTYGGTLGKAKLEQMYSKYAVSGMMSMDENFNARVGLLQDVFSITEKKAEGLMMKAMQKNMMKMLKDGEGMEGMEEMMKAMGGEGALEGLEGLAGMDSEDGPSPEQLKEMLLALKTMKDSGTIPPAELAAVRGQFREAFGSSIEEVMADADKDQESMSEADQELLDLMKSILDD